MEQGISVKEKEDIKINSEIYSVIDNLDIENRQKLVSSVEKNKLIIQDKTINDCIDNLKALGLDDKEIEKLDIVIDSIIDNRLDFIFSKLYN